MKNFSLGILLTIILAFVSKILSGFIPYELISAGVFAMLIGMAINPLLTKNNFDFKGINFVSKKVLKGAIVLMGITLSFTQIVMVGKFSLIVMTFTLLAAFGFGNLFGKLFKMNWKLSNLISAGTGICGGSAIAAISPVIEAEDSDVAYAISATFIFDIVMVILFPIMGHYFDMSDLGYGLWAGTAVNDTSSVVAAGYAFSDIAGNYATIVKLTRTLSIVPITLIFALVNQNLSHKQSKIKAKFSITKIFPWFILLFLGMVVIRTIMDTLVINNIMSQSMLTFLTSFISATSKFAMIMALGAIGLKTDFKKVAKSGFVPMLHGFIISTLVVIVSFVVQLLINQI